MPNKNDGSVSFGVYVIRSMESDTEIIFSDNMRRSREMVRKASNASRLPSTPTEKVRTVFIGKEVLNI